MKKLTAEMLLLLTIQALAILPFAGQVQAATKLYAGYYFKGYEWNAGKGIDSVIYTINPYVGSGNVLYEWPCVILSYNPLYWIQVGYTKGPATGYTLKYYTEKWDANGHSGVEHLPDGPAAGTSKGYMIRYNGSPVGKWDLLIQGQIRKSYIVNPYVAKDYQAFVESTFACIIDGSHFSLLRYFDGSSWYYWYTHVRRADYPFWVSEISNYEFTAWTTIPLAQEADKR